ncbi:response regulator [Zooshikella ganghwensis]|uniref:response regulator n=1 Tax=Zooshikella ganghwensis TaxID=202772 RepID=UPI00040399FC|nr:response regulator [Zooshikella ganghwensis]
MNKNIDSIKGSLFNQQVNSPLPPIDPMKSDQRALIIGDSLCASKLLEILSNYLPIDVLVASDSASAVKMLASYQPTLIFICSDIKGLTCLSMLKMLKDNLSNKDTPIIIINERGENYLSELAPILGASACVNIPFRSKEITDLVNQYLPESALNETYNVRLLIQCAEKRQKIARSLTQYGYQPHFYDMNNISISKLESVDGVWIIDYEDEDVFEFVEALLEYENTAVLFGIDEPPMGIENKHLFTLWQQRLINKVLSAGNN